MNIGLEMVADPAVLFLDEPTSGLDSTASTLVLAALKEVAQLGVTVATVIHQVSLFYLPLHFANPAHNLTRIQCHLHRDSSAPLLHLHAHRRNATPRERWSRRLSRLVFRSASVRCFFKLPSTLRLRRRLRCFFVPSNGHSFDHILFDI